LIILTKCLKFLKKKVTFTVTSCILSRNFMKTGAEAKQIVSALQHWLTSSGSTGRATGCWVSDVACRPSSIAWRALSTSASLTIRVTTTVAPRRAAPLAARRTSWCLPAPTTSMCTCGASRWPGRRRRQYGGAARSSSCPATAPSSTKSGEAAARQGGHENW
jgi:hypothetical protein